MRRYLQHRRVFQSFNAVTGLSYYTGISYNPMRTTPTLTETCGTNWNFGANSLSAYVSDSCLIRVQSTCSSTDTNAYIESRFVLDAEL